MKKTVTNGTVFVMTQVLFGERNEDGTIKFEGLINKKNMKTRMAVRQALKFNYASISNTYKLIDEMINDITKELVDEFIENEKAHNEENKLFFEKDEFREEFLKIQQEKLNELSMQTIELDITTIPEKEYLAYAEQNDGQLTELELDILELFVDFDEQKEDVVNA